MKTYNVRYRMLALILGIVMMVASFPLQSGSVEAATVKPTGITISNCGTGKLTLPIDGKYTLKTSVAPSNATNKELAFSSSDKTIASVSTTGVITGKKKGTATITVKAKGNTSVVKKISCTVVAKDAFVKVKSMKFSMKKLYVGNTAKVSVTFSPSNASNKNLTWTSSDKSIATVDCQGRVTARKAGTVTITGKANDGSGKSAKINVEIDEKTKVRIVYQTKAAEVIYLDGPGKVDKPSKPTSKYATFDNWYTDSSYSEVFDFNSVIEEDTDIYARWIETDSDGDDIPNEMEEYYDLNNGKAKSANDYDGDGLTDYQEIYVFGTDPTLTDSDKDGVSDGKEDYDQDGLNNLKEIKLGTDPADEDSDDDGLKDGDEVSLYKTKPLIADTDGDGLKDGDEVRLGYDPVKAKSDGINLDGERSYYAELPEQAYDGLLLSGANAMVPFLTTEDARGLLEEHVAVHTADRASFPDNQIYIGYPVEVVSDYDNWTGALSFHFSNSNYSEETVEEFWIVRWLDGSYVPMETERQYEEGVLSCSIQESGVYQVMNLHAFLATLGFPVDEWLGDSKAAEPEVEMDEGQDSVSQLIADIQDASMLTPRGVSSESKGDGTYDYKTPVDLVVVYNTNDTMLDNYAAHHDSIFRFIEAMKQEEISFDYSFSLYWNPENDNGDSIHSVQSGMEVRKLTSSMYPSCGYSIKDSCIDAIETARKHGFRPSAEKYILLFTDEDWSLTNQCGIQSMEQEIQKLNSDGIHLFVISDKKSKSSYKALYEGTGGKWANLNSDFGSSLSLWENQIVENAVSGTWILNKEYQYVHLPEIKEAEQDSDGDGISDLEEVGRPVPMDVTDAIISMLKEHGINPEDVIYNGQIIVYEDLSDPNNPDTDYDGIDDKTDPKVNDNNLTLTYNHYYPEERKSRISKKGYTVHGETKVKMDYSWFFQPNTTYNEELGKMSLVYAGSIYKQVSISGLPEEGLGVAKVNVNGLMKALGMQDVELLDLKVKNPGYNPKYTDQHVSEVAFGHRKVTCNGQTKEIIQVVVRGTNGTLSEWESNFDVGKSTSCGRVDEWVTAENHMGFDITSNRILKMLKAYVEKYVDASYDSAYWITGHSRGAGISNLLGAYLVDEGQTVYDYTFASPNTTTASDRGNYLGIYNLVNVDDFVPYLPMWGFGHYGKTAEMDMAGYKDEWATYTGISKYNAADFWLTYTLGSLKSIATKRSDLYKISSKYVYWEKCGKKTSAEAKILMNSFLASLPENFTNSSISDTIYTSKVVSYEGTDTDTYKINYGYQIQECPAYFMQVLACLLGKEVKASKLVFGNSCKFSDKFVSNIFFLTCGKVGGINHPHYTETYHILTEHVSDKEFK